METPGAKPCSAGTAGSEHQMVARARSGDADAFRALVDAHADRAYGLALRIVRLAPEAEEVAQDAFVKAWNALPRFRGDAMFSTWLHRIVVRCALDRLARLKARDQRETSLDNGLLEPVSPLQPPDARTRLRIERLVAELPEAQRAVVTLFYLEDRSVVDVAHLLGLNENTVKTHLHRARTALRRAWQEDEAR